MNVIWELPKRMRWWDSAKKVASLIALIQGSSAHVCSQSRELKKIKIKKQTVVDILTLVQLINEKRTCSSSQHCRLHVATYAWPLHSLTTNHAKIKWCLADSHHPLFNCGHNWSTRPPHPDQLTSGPLQDSCLVSRDFCRFLKNSCLSCSTGVSIGSLLQET